MLWWAKDEGHIYDYKKLGNGYFKIEVPSTHYEDYHYPDRRGVLVLKTREVFAFIEGVYAAMAIHPVRRAGDLVGPARRDTAQRFREPEPEVEDPASREVEDGLSRLSPGDP